MKWFRTMFASSAITIWKHASVITRAHIQLIWKQFPCTWFLTQNARGRERGVSGKREKRQSARKRDEESSVCDSMYAWIIALDLCADCHWQQTFESCVQLRWIPAFGEVGWCHSVTLCHCLHQAPKVMTIPTNDDSARKHFLALIATTFDDMSVGCSDKIEQFEGSSSNSYCCSSFFGLEACFRIAHTRKRWSFGCLSDLASKLEHAVHELNYPSNSLHKVTIRTPSHNVASNLTNEVNTY